MAIFVNTSSVTLQTFKIAVMELSKNYNPGEIETKWYNHWLEKGYFKSVPDERKPFTVVIPPPNVTGVLHMGHTLNETVQDILVRRSRQLGFNACWVPGSDHASIATEARVVNMLKEKGIDKASLSREEFLEYAFEWKEKYGGIIYSQIKKLGCSVDWDRVTFTMDQHYYQAVIKVFIDLFNKGLIYRGARMINWDPSAKTALSDEEVEYKDIQGTLYYLSYPLEIPGSGKQNNTITIATQRPETIMGDTAICVNPEDPRYADLHEAYAFVPLINRRIPIIFDTYVDPSFGTGALKVTPAHDINDYNLGLKYNLDVIDTLNEDGTLSEAAEIHIGEDRFTARKNIVKELEEQGYLQKKEEYTTRLGYSQRTGVVVEPRISTQWFLKMQDMSQSALDAVLDGTIKIHPGERFLATYKYWMENLKDWCISRQLWWGQRIPAWYDASGRFVVAENLSDAKDLFERSFRVADADLTQDPDVLDTWFSSWLWPMEVFKGISDPGNADLKYYYPTSVLVTGQDIIFFWVARMVMAGMEYEKEIPFSDVYFTGMVRDKQGRKMSKSLGNSPDLLDLIDKYGADAVRFGIMISSPAGNDLLFDEASLEQGRNFNNKIWNALKLVTIWGEKNEEIQEAPGFAIQWFRERLIEAAVSIDGLIKQFRLSEALKVLYSLIWDDFCSWYLEWVKPAFGQPMSTANYKQTVEYFTELMQLLHPFMPFITEEVYHLLSARQDDICALQLKDHTASDSSILDKGNLLQTLITDIRDTRNKNQIKPKDPIGVCLQTVSPANYSGLEDILAKQINASSISFVSESVPGSISLLSGKDTIYLQSTAPIDSGAQRESMLKEIDYLKGFIASVEKKLGNERFVQNAKAEVVNLERRKKADAEAKISALEVSLSGLV